MHKDWLGKQEEDSQQLTINQAGNVPAFSLPCPRKIHIAKITMYV
jgi:hypothetical protein